MMIKYGSMIIVLVKFIDIKIVGVIFGVVVQLMLCISIVKLFVFVKIVMMNFLGVVVVMVKPGVNI